ncbi:NAD(P)H-dependent oxidoreductase [Cupriavidus pinatubonensis]|uniref:NAD(P)H-dependent oxidoreductase n=1 Tax=Cupriavidus pinatubonensis TaxID=248026 RepID=UPI00112D0397|nr:NAD(P)H-dependent oxidoreductase [Cupriavidus pinatubonensis]TPQ25174.1 hypothetical protein C2U69_35755 [Cupriavidus pinatubonensis]
MSTPGYVTDFAARAGFRTPQDVNADIAAGHLDLADGDRIDAIAGDANRRPFKWTKGSQCDQDSPCSPRENSQSRLVAEALLETYTATRPDAHVDALDLWDLQLPEMREDVLNAKYAIFARREHTAA